MTFFKPSSKGQINFEYLVLTGVLLIIFIPITYTSLSTLHEHYQTSSISDILAQITNKANELYQLGPGNKDELHISLPSGITGATVSGNEVSYASNMKGKPTLIRQFTQPEVVGSLDIIRGDYVVPIRSINETLVLIGPGPYLFDIYPACIGAPNFANPVNITLLGGDFDSSTLLLKDGVVYPSSFYTVVSSSILVFTADPTQYNVEPSGSAFSFTVKQGSRISNVKTLTLFPSISRCS